MILDRKTGKLEVRGNAYPPNAPEFFARVTEWFEKAMQEGRLETVDFTFYFHYLNTGFAKMLLQFMERFEPFCESGKPCQITWLYDADDDVILNIGRDVREFVSLPVELREAE